MRPQQWLAGGALSLVGWLLKREVKSMGPSITIGGVAFPAGDIEAVLNVFPALNAAVKAGKGAKDIAELLEPALLPAAETIASAVFPQGGLIVEAIAYAISKSHPATTEEQRRQNDKADGAGIRDAAGNKTDSF